MALERMFDKIFRKRKKIDDEVFGKLIFYPQTANEESYWFTNLKFGLEQKQIDCTIYNDEQDIALEQREFYCQLEKNYSGLTLIIEEFINSELKAKDWLENNIAVEQNLELYSFIIPST